ncbi:MAG: sensor histidine kinase [Snowella sp.]|nr:MAG: sensor histidine kinase [Snowella sp.]
MSDIEQLTTELENTKIAYQMAQEINQLKTGFLGRAAHELRSPLSSLISLHQLILFDFCENPEEEKQFLEHAYQSAQKLLEMIDELILVSKLDYGAVPFNLEPIDLNSICFELESLTKLQSANRNLKVVITPDSAPVNVLVDQGRLLQTLVMLIDTGIREMTKGSIQVSIKGNKIENLAHIDLDIPCPLESWQKDPDSPLDTQTKNIEQWKKFSENLHHSPKMKFLLAQTLFQKMGGELMLSSINKANSTETITQIQGVLQLATPAGSNLAED